ncbi:MAG: hypothetical protein ABJ118_15315 [Luteolibacter sp.]
MNIALGELQKTAGPDQRVTAGADILSESDPLTPAEGHAHWVGVWDTSDYHPSKPTQKTFLGWLVSSPDPLSDESDASAAQDPDDFTIFLGDDAESSVVVPKIAVNDGSQYPGAYAYWVEDEGLKADLSWSEATTPDSVVKQASRLSAAPGPDYGVFDGPFNGEFTYPLEENSTPWLQDMVKVISTADMALVTSSSGHQQDWLRTKRHDVTVGSLGVVADMKLGGLKRDLSLAFEMDGEADVSATSFPQLFSKQVGEFVGGNDRLASPHLAGGMRGVYERFLYRDHSAAGGIFSGDIANSYTSPYWASVRGPSWWALRDYANLYKRLAGSNGDYSMAARAYYPNTSARALDPSLPSSTYDDYTLGEIARAEKAVPRVSGSNAWNSELNSTSSYIFRPARASYAPVALGSVNYFSLKRGPGSKLQLIADPTFYLWNPYNRTIHADKYAVEMMIGLPGRLKFVVKRADGSQIQYGPNDFSDFTSERSDSQAVTYLLSGLRMEPGEVLAASPPPGDTNRNSSLALGSQPTETTGLTVKKFPVPNTDANGNVVSVTWSEVTIGPDDEVTAYYELAGGRGQAGEAMHSYSYRMHTSLPLGVTNAGNLSNRSLWGDQIQSLAFWLNDKGDAVHDVEVDSAGVTLSSADLGGKSTGAFAAVAYLALPADSAAPVEIFSQFNPAAVGNNERSFDLRCDPNYTFRARCVEPGGLNYLIDEMGADFPMTVRNAYWGESYLDAGSTHIPITHIPSNPLNSLVEFSHAALTTKTSEPYHAVGNSWASVMVSPVSPYGVFSDNVNRDGVTAADASWLLNDALFDRYFLSGIAQDYSISSSGYHASGSLEETLTNFFGPDYRSANANPVLRPYLPDGKTAAEIVAELDDTAEGKGYMKMAAYSLISGQFNVNSTSVEAWRALLQANKDLAVRYAGTGSDSSSGTPFPSSKAPAYNGTGSGDYWSGFSRLDDDEIADLAMEIVKQVKLRGPFMSLSDFVNHRVGGTSPTALHYMGALQAAIEETDINGLVQRDAGGISPDYRNGAFSQYFEDPLPNNDRRTTTGIPGDVSQTNLLLPLAPRLNARSDTFCIRAYGEVRSEDGTKILASATCETVVQRFPEYMDSQTDASNNEPWDQALENPLPLTVLPKTSLLNETNTRFGRRFRVVGFKWLPPADA